MNVAVAKKISLSKITMEFDAEIVVKCSLLKSEFLVGSRISYYLGLQKFAKHLNAIAIESILSTEI